MNVIFFECDLLVNIENSLASAYFNLAVMREAERDRVLMLIALGLMVALLYGSHGKTAEWKTIATNFGRNDKPCGGGAFRIRNNDVISLKLAGPQITFKPRSEQNTPGVAEPTEEWMNDTAELLNRRKVYFLKGTLDGGLVRTFEERGQSPAWWYSPDWRTVYISAGWTDYKAPKPSSGLLPQVTKLWRSRDGGQTWTRLAHEPCEDQAHRDTGGSAGVG